MPLSFLFPCEGTNNSTTFVDESISPKTITAYGNAKFSTSKSKIGSTSVELDGSDSSILITSHADLNFDAADFTVECWVYRVSITQDSCLFTKRNTPTGSGGYTQIFVYFNNLYPAFYIGQDGGGWAIANLNSSIQAPLSTWTHIALVRNGNVFTLYVNGVSGCSQSAAVTLFSNSADFTIGGDFPGSGNTYLNGYVDQIRIVKGKALYTGTFIPPLRPFNTYDLLLQFNGANGSTSFLDSSYDPKTVTAFGNAQTSTDQYNYGISSLYLDGTGDYVTISNHADLNFENKNFTIEFYLFTEVINTNQVLLCKRTVAAYCEIYFYLANDIPTLYVSSDQSIWEISALSSSIPILVSRWNHLALVRNGSNFRIYVNGVSGVESNGFSGNLLTNTEPFVIGADYSGSPYANLNGYIKDLRIIKGKALYTSSFTPPSSITTNNSLLLNFEGTDGSTSIVDESISKKTVTAYGGAVISTTQKRKGTSSLYLEGTTSYLRSPPSFDFYFGSGNFTIECYFNSNISTYGSLCGIWGASGYRSWHIYIGGASYSGGQVWFYWSTNGSSYSNLTFNTPYQANVWKHLALVRFGNYVYLFINGLLVGSPQSLTDTFFNASTTQDLTIGASEISGGEYYKGYIDELKITKGESFYVKNFFLADDLTNYSLLLNFNGPNNSTTITDESSSPKTITVGGDAKLSTSQYKFNASSLTLDGSGDYLITPTSSDLQFGTSDFTIEAWIYPLSFANAPNVFSQRDGSSGVTLRIQNAGILVFFGPGSNSLSQLGTLINLSEWTHIALVRNGATFNSYINGVFSGTKNLGTGYSLSYNDPTWIGGASGYNEYFNGYIGQLKVVKGLAKYSYNFTFETEGPSFLYFYDTFNDYFSSFISYYSLADESGTTLLDKTTSYPLTLSADTVIYQDVSLVQDFDFSMTFSGQSASSATFLNLNGYKEFSVGFVLKTSTVSQTIVSKSGVFSVSLDSSGFISWTVNSNSLVGNVSVTDNLSHYVICSYREGGLFLSVDGNNGGYILPSGLTVTDAGTQPLVIGTFTGTLDEVFLLSSFMNYPRSNFYYNLLTDNLSSFSNNKTMSTFFFDSGAPPSNWLSYCFLEKTSKNSLDCEYSANVTFNPTIYTKATFVPINGFVTLEGIPTSRQVFLLEWYNKRIVRTTWSDPSTGYYEFTDVKAGYYFVWCPDHLESFRPISSKMISNFT